MKILIPISISLVALSFYVYMTGLTGVLILALLIGLAMFLVYKFQNKLLYMPGTQKI